MTSAAFLALVAHMGPSSAVIVETPPGEVASVKLSLAIDNDWQFQEGECLLIPILVSYGRADDTSIIGELTVTKATDPSVANEGTFLVLPGDPVSGQLLDEIFVCPADGTGEYRLNSVIRAIEPSQEQAFPLDALTFWVRPATSTMSDLNATAIKGGTRISGAVEAGRDFATGIVEIRYRSPGRSQWTVASRVPVEEGTFDVVLDRTLPARSIVKATLTGCSWCTRVSDTTSVR